MSGLKKTQRVLIIILISLLALLTVAAAYQAIASKVDRQALVAPGELIDLGGYSLHLKGSGEGGPVVILEAGLADNWLSWSAVQDEISAFTRVYSYDRPGFGWSDSQGKTRSGAAAAKTLHGLLENAGVPGPYVLVGHSLGGLYVREFARRYPDDTAGLLLVDSAHENQIQRLPEAIRRDEMEGILAQKQMLKLGSVLSVFGVPRLLGLVESYGASWPLDETQRRALTATMNRSSYYSSALMELDSMIDGKDDGQQRPAALGDVPLIVLTTLRSSADNPGRMTEGISPETYALADAEYFAMQKELSQLSSRGEMVVVEDSGHYIQNDRPDEVVDAVRRLVDYIRTDR